MFVCFFLCLVWFDLIWFSLLCFAVMFAVLCCAVLCFALLYFALCCFVFTMFWLLASFVCIFFFLVHITTQSCTFTSDIQILFLHDPQAVWLIVSSPCAFYLIEVNEIDREGDDRGERQRKTGGGGGGGGGRQTDRQAQTETDRQTG